MTQKSCTTTLVTLLAWSAVPLQASPQPGDVFRQYFYFGTRDVPPGEHLSEVDPGATFDFTKSHQWAAAKRDNPSQPRPVALELAGAERAEFTVEFWGGHIGTSNQKVSINGGEWRPLPQPVGTPGNPVCYFRTLLGNNGLSIDPSTLIDGENLVRFSAGPQVCRSFGWGFYWIYDFGFRLYEPRGSVPASGSLTIETSPETVTLQYDPPDDMPAVTSVDFIARYSGFDIAGRRHGLIRDWHYTTRRGRLTNHVGGAERAPYTVSWDTTWIPDQGKPVDFVAWVHLQDGRTVVTEATSLATLPRKDRSIAYFPTDAVSIPVKYGAREGEEASATMTLPDLRRSTDARIILSSWSAATDDGSRHDIVWNGEVLARSPGVWHDYDLDLLPIAPSKLLPGENTIALESDYHGHSFEINWPGVALLAEYQE